MERDKYGTKNTNKMKSWISFANINQIPKKREKELPLPLTNWFWVTHILYINYLYINIYMITTL